MECQHSNIKAKIKDSFLCSSGTLHQTLRFDCSLKIPPKSIYRVSIQQRFKKYKLHIVEHLWIFDNCWSGIALTAYAAKQKPLSNNYFA